MTSLKPRIDLAVVNRRFRRLTLNTVITLYCLILAGGVVRSTGAGMGCPDWPKCFGSWIPPTDVSQLPSDYKEIYGAKLKGEIEFNPVKTWIEYVNRLLGAFTGIMIFLTLIASIPYLKAGSPSVFYYSLSAFILVGIQGWLGSKVVSTELEPVMITMHMLLAIIIVFILLYLFTWAFYSNSKVKTEFKSRKVLNAVGGVVLICSVCQILLGTQVRETIDEAVKLLGYAGRDKWVESLGLDFYVHRSFSIVIAGINLWWFYKIIRDRTADGVVRKCVTWCLVMIGIEVLSGIIMAYWGVPAYAQPVHLTFAIGLIGLQFVIFMLVNGNRIFGRRNTVGVENEMV
jgi:cytochrome c oxidase assembly protein subunit 15